MKEIGVITKRNIDSNGNPVLLDINNETKQVLKGLIFLNEVPAYSFKVRITGMKEIPYDKEIVNENEFKVHYTFGFICFHPNKEGKNIVITNYKGTGYALIDASRVVTKWAPNGDIEGTLDEALDEFEFESKQLLAKIDAEWREQKQSIEDEWNNLRSNVLSEWETIKQTIYYEWDNIKQDVDTEWNDKKQNIDTEWNDKKQIIDDEFNKRTEIIDAQIKDTSEFLTTSEERMVVINKEHKQNMDNIQDAIHNVDNNFKIKTHKYIATTTVDEFDVPSNEFNEIIDSITMYFKGVYLHAGEDYSIIGSRVRLIGWTLKAGEIIEYQILRSGEIPPFDSSGVVTRPMLSPDLQNEINGLNNQTFIINAADWKLKDNGLYEYVLNHGRNSKNIIISFYDTTGSAELFCAYEYVDFNNIKVISDGNAETKVIIAISYYGYQGEIHSLASFNTDDLVQTKDKQYVTEEEKEAIRGVIDGDVIGAAYIGDVPPENTNVLWVDTADEDIDGALMESEILDEFRYALGDIRKDTDNIGYKLKYKLDGGYFLGKEPGTTINAFEETYGFIKYTGDWKVDSDVKHSKGSAKYSDSIGSSFTFSFDGDGFKLYGLCGLSTGKADIYIDGEKQEIDTYSSFDAYNYVYCNKVIEGQDVHTITVEVSGNKNFASAGTRIYIDKIEIINGNLIENPSALSIGEEPESENPFSNNRDNPFEGTIGVLSLKRGYKADIAEIPLQEGELAFCLDTEELYIGNRGVKKLLAKVGGSGGSSGGSLTGKYVELESSSGKKYRISVNNDGAIDVWDSAVDLAVSPNKNEASRFKGLIVNHIYGGGAKNANKSVVSHSYIEIYNNSKTAHNLKGLSIQYASNNEPWKVLELRGIVKPQHSFLIRCSQVTEPTRLQVRHKIEDYDMHWEQDLSSNSMKVYLCVGTDPCVYTNPFNINGAGMKDEGYIDLFAVGGKNPMFTIDACETSYIHAIDVDHSAHRIDFADTDKGFEDIESINMKTSSAIYKPRSSKFGRWDVHYDKIELDENIPMMINMCFGYDGNTSRTFTWQTKKAMKNFLQYRKKGSNDWVTEECDKKTITHPDTDATVQSIIIHGLSQGVYEYRAGSEGRWTDIYSFEIKTPANNEKISFLHVTDQQGWNEEEYSAWEIISRMIKEKESYDFVINTGDISQNGGSKAFEWRYYYDMAKETIYNCPHMTCVGNNDLTIDDDGKKTDPTAFTYYSTVENSEHISCYSWNYGYCHFISLNSNVFSVDHKILTDQIEWLRRDSAKPENKKRWTVVYMHEAPYTQTRSNILVPFIDVFAEIGVDLVLCGHHHRYSRSKRMGALGSNGQNQQSPTGYYTIMSQATGFKLEGKSPEASNNHEWMDVYNTNKIPMYIVWDITYDKMKMNCYRIEDLVPFEENIGKTPRITEFDKGFEITKPL